METEAMKALTKARIRMMLPNQSNGLVWFGNLATRLVAIETDKIPTMGVDGTRLYFNPKFTLALSRDQLNFTLAHEVMHCALLHPFRFDKIKSRYYGILPEPDLHKIANCAADYVVNASLIECNDSTMRPPANIKVDGKEVFDAVLYDKKYSGMNFEEVMADLMAQVQKNQQQGKQAGSASGKGSPLDDVTAPPKPSPGDGDTEGDGDGSGDSPGDGAGKSLPDSGMSEEDWKIAVTEAQKGNGLKAGNIPGNIARSMESAYEPEIPWRAVMRKFVTNTIPRDYMWAKPSRRFVSSGIYVPGVLKENTGELVLCVDMSGSITPEWLQQSGAEIRALCMQCRPDKVHVLYFDTVISHHDVFTGSYADLKLEAHGGGGTAFQPMFDFVESKENKIKPVAMIVFTDLYCGDSPKEPKYPVLWVVPKTNAKKDFAFGKVLPV